MDVDVDIRNDVENEVEEPNSVWFPQEDDGHDATGNEATLRFWKINPEAIDRLQAGPTAPVFSPFLDPFTPLNPLATIR